MNVGVGQTARFTIPSLGAPGAAQDISGALLGVSGIGGIEIDVAAQAIIVAYDPDFLDAEALRSFIERAGYPVQHDD